MNLFERAKKIIIDPKNEWVVIEQETTPVVQLVTTYLMVLAIIPAVAVLINYGFLARFGFLSWGIKQAIVSYIGTVGGAFLSAFIIDALATNFGATKDFRKAMQLVVYSWTPMMLAGIFNIIPGLSILTIVGLYGLYLLYLGIAPIMKAPDNKVTGYFIVSLLVIIVVYMVLAAILGAVIIGSTMASTMIIP